MVVGTLTAFGRKAVQDGRFGLFEVGKGQDSFGGRFFLRGFDMGDGLLDRPP